MRWSPNGGLRRAGRIDGYPRRALAVGALLLLAAGPLALAPTPTPSGTASSGAPSPGASPGAGDRGRQLYLQNCASCHGVQGGGTQRGPSLVGVGPASVDFQLSTGRMPVSQEVQQARRGEPIFSAEDIERLVDHVAGFGDGGPEIPRIAPGNVMSGREIFAANCAPCHSATGAGGTLTNGWIAPPLYEATAQQIAEAVRVGPGLMPVFPGQVLTDRQVDDVTSYVRLLQNERLDRGGNPLGRFGPSSEGLVAWAIAMVLVVIAARWLGRRAGQ